MANPTEVLDSAATIPGETLSRVALSPQAVALLQKLWGRHGALMFHQSGGCCDGSSPMCYPQGEFITAEADVLLGLFDLPGCGPLEFWMSREQFNYWSHTHLTVDVVQGRGSGFSVEAPEGVRFLIRSRLVEGFRPVGG
ncbi:uncharacterized protein (DUF779 family) [Arthrobacter silviterrae]|uniref:DUF779 domain-containing protein n=1 Tax=Arthrobacter silviterrae TaxID=2026658 RepID=A0ABX0DCI4_9MICC|nr:MULTISPECIES: DUF779 domain-containing protein [Arthrobacter]MCU6482526.1 DUF779 domain-containing protein [Arthrobacter sp. A2-55]MDQ0279363.1 uncharacterized protein (DUF779 family) [Arthrobacter silviterrae]NGN83436.1 DUF779 domain-containing protein [Arthrobacter silviterrae]